MISLELYKKIAVYPVIVRYALLVNLKGKALIQQRK